MFGEQHTRPSSTDPAVCGTPPRPGGLCGEGPCPARELPPRLLVRGRRPPSSGCSGGTAVCPGSAFLSEFCALHPALPVLPVPENASAPTPPHGVGCPACGRGPGSWRGEQAVPHEADECVRTESGGRRPSSARRCRCCGPQPRAAAGGDREGACSRARLCLVRSVGVAPGAGQWTSLLGPRSVSHGDFGGARLDSDCVPVCPGGSMCVVWGAVAVSAGVESERPARARPGASWSWGAGGPGGAARPKWSSWRGTLHAWGFQGAESHLRCFCAVAAVLWLPSSSSGVNLPAGWLLRVWARCRREERVSVCSREGGRSGVVLRVSGAPVGNTATRHGLPAAPMRRAPCLARSVGPLSVSFALSVDNIHSGRFFLESHGVSLCVLCEVSFEN